MFYKIITECGHAGAGNRLDKVWFMKGRDPLNALEKAKRLPGVKRKASTVAIKLIQEITRGEYYRRNRR